MSRQGARRKNTSRNVKNFWESEAKEWGNSPQVTIRDFFFRNHEIDTLLSVIPRCKKLLDIGCGTGFGTLALAKKAERTIGVDYSEKMIEWAIRAKNDPNYRAKEAWQLKLHCDLLVNSNREVDFTVGDIQNLRINEKTFDVITGQRILINLPSHRTQMKALRNLRRYATKNTKLILTEATIQGHQRTDQYRKTFGLPKLEKYWHNNYVDESRYGEWEKHGWRIIAALYFETYTLLSKVIYPAAVSPQKCVFLSGANEAASEIANIFRTQAASREIGFIEMLCMYAERVRSYNPVEGKAIFRWINKHSNYIPDWVNLGHQHIIIAESDIGRK